MRRIAVTGVESDEEDGGDVGAEALENEVAECGTDARGVPQTAAVRRVRRVPGVPNSFDGGGLDKTKCKFTKEYRVTLV